jgi:hypothetical protein
LRSDVATFETCIYLQIMHDLIMVYVVLNTTERKHFL